VIGRLGSRKAWSPLWPRNESLGPRQFKRRSYRNLSDRLYLAAFRRA